MIFLKRFLKIAIWIFIGSCLWVMAAFFGSNYTVEIFVQETRRSSFEKLNLFGSIGKIFNTQQELLIKIIENDYPRQLLHLSLSWCWCLNNTDVSNSFSLFGLFVWTAYLCWVVKEQKKFDIEAKIKYRRNHSDNIARWYNSQAYWWNVCIARRCIYFQRIFGTSVEWFGIGRFMDWGRCGSHWLRI